MISGLYGVVIAVSNIDEATKHYEALLGMRAAHGIDPEAENTMARLVFEMDSLTDIGIDRSARSTYFKLPGGVRVTLVSSSQDGSVITNFIKSHGEGVMIVSLRVEDVATEVRRIKDGGLPLLLDHNAVGSFGETNFVNAKALNGVRFEIFKPAQSYQ